MASVSFYLDSKEDENKDRQIFMNFRYRGKRYRLFSGKKIAFDKWDVDKQRANSKKYKNNCIGFNSFLQNLSDEIEGLTNNNKPLSITDFKSIIDKANGKNTKDSFFGFSESYLRQQIEKGEMAEASAKSYSGTLNHLKKLRHSLTFDEVDLNFYDKFVTHLKNNGISVNSIGGHIKRLKWFMAAALDRDLHSNVSFKKKAFKANREETDQIYLTRKEITKLSKKSLSSRLKKVVDAFVINCFLGQRYSDWQQMQKHNFKKMEDLFYWNIVQDKTGEKIQIPVPTEVLPILKRYNFTCPVISSKGKLMSVQKFNDYLKEAAELAGIDSIEDIRENGEVKKLPKNQLIKSHTARRSFATNLYLDGVPVQNIMAITGHKKEETFLLYVRADQLTKSKGLARHYQNTGNSRMRVVKGGRAA